MAAETQTKIFGMKLGVDPKILLVGLMALAGLLFWLNSRGDEPRATVASAPHVNEPAPVAEPPATTHPRTTTRDRRMTRSDRGTLKLKPVAPGSGDVDPVLRLDLLDKLARVEPAPEERNLFEMESAQPAAAQNNAGMPKVSAPKPLPLPPPPMITHLPTPQISIPLRYYGFAKPSRPGDVNRGFFIEGDDVMVAAEGQVLKGQYHILQLTPANAIVQDMRANMSQALPVTPEALEPGGNAGGNVYGRQNGIMSPNNGFQNQMQNEGNEP